MLPQQGHEDEDRPETVNDAGNGSQQLGEKGQRTAQRMWGTFR